MTQTATKTQKTDNRSLEQVAKSVAAMRRRIGAITRKHAKLQERIARLEKQGRIISLSHDSDILVGIDCWYVKAESLNPNPDSNTNYYYETTYNAEAGYGCSCERLNGDCKHITKLAATFAPVATPEEVAEVEGSKAESKMFAWKRAMDEQYASDPRTELAKQREEEETRRANVRMFYDGL